MSSSSRPRATAARCRCSPAPPRRSALTSPTSCPPRPRPSSAVQRRPRRVPPPARPVGRLRRCPARSPARGAPRPGRRPARHRCRPPCLASGPGRVRPRRSGLLRAGAGGPARPAAQRLRRLVTGVRAAAPGWRPMRSRTGRLLYAAADAAWLGGLADRAAALLDEARQRASARDLAVSIEHLRGHIAARRGPIGDAQQILLAAAEQAAPAEPGRAVVMLAEAVNASFYAGDAAAMRHAADRIAALTPADPDDRTAFFALSAQGMALIFSGEGERGAAAIRESVEVLERSDELRRRPPPPRLGRHGGRPGSGRRTSGGRSPTGRSTSPARSSAVGVLPFVLTHVAIDQAATDRWAEAQASFHEGDRPRPGDRSAHGTGDLAGAPRVAGSEAGQVRPEPPARRRGARPVPRVRPRPVRGLGDRRAGRSRARLRPPGAGPRPLRGAAGRAPLAWHRRRRPVARAGTRRALPPSRPGPGRRRGRRGLRARRGRQGPAMGARPGRALPGAARGRR